MQYYKLKEISHNINIWKLIATDAECQDDFLHEIRGLLRVYEEEKIKQGKVNGGLEECKKLCIAEDRCRAVGYADHITQLELSSGQYIREEKQ